MNRSAAVPAATLPIVVDATKDSTPLLAVVAAAAGDSRAPVAVRSCARSLLTIDTGVARE